MKVLVTGGTGFLGKHIQEAFEPYKNKYNLYFVGKKFNGIDYSLDNQERCRELFNIIKPNIVIHAAAKCGGIGLNKNQPADLMLFNIKMNTNVLEQCLRHNVDYTYTLGSVCAYPKYCPTPFKEDDLWEGQPEETNMGYGVSKKTMMLLFQMMKQQYGIKGAHLIPVNMYGECFSEDTSLAAPGGFKNIKDFNVGDLIYTLNPDNHNVEIEKVIATQKRKSKNFINFKGSIVDLRVTPEHKIYYKTNKTFLKRKAEYFISRAGKKHGMIRFAINNKLYSDVKVDNFISLKDYANVKSEIKNNFIRDYKHSSSHWVPLQYDIKDFYEFLGWYISEGSIISDDNSSNKQVSISQSSQKNKENREQIAALITRMNLPLQMDPERFYFTSSLWRDFIKKEIGTSCENKKIPEHLLNAPVELLEILFNSLMKGDGDKDFLRYTTKSKILKDQIILISMLIGKKIGKVFLDKNNVWRIKFRQIKTNSVKYKDIIVENNQNEEDVYCITTEKNHIVYAGRNNKYSWVGQCDHFDLENSHVIPALINKFTNAVKNNLPEVYCWGTGTATREFFYAGDCARAIVQAVEKRLDTELPINLGSGKEISIKALAELIGQLTEFKGKIIFTGEVSDGQPRRLLEVSRAKEMLDFEAQTTLLSGLTKTICWYEEELGKVRL